MQYQKEYGKKSEKTSIQNEEIKLEKRPYNFQVPVLIYTRKSFSIPSYRNFNRYKNDNKYGIKIEESSETGEISVSSFNFIIKTPGLLFFKVQKEEIENFKKAMINGGTFKCFERTTYLDIFGQKDEEKVIITYGEKFSKGHVFLDFKDSSYAIPFNSLKEKL